MVCPPWEKNHMSTLEQRLQQLTGSTGMATKAPEFGSGSGSGGLVTGPFGGNNSVLRLGGASPTPANREDARSTLG